jgi:hypothetical protein
MKATNFIKAVTILTENHSNEIIVNISRGHISNTGNAENPTLHIKNCTASSINKLKEAGFSLSMDNGLLSVDDYAIH